MKLEGQTNEADAPSLSSIRGSFRDHQTKIIIDIIIIIIIIIIVITTSIIIIITETLEREPFSKTDK